MQMNRRDFAFSSLALALAGCAENSSGTKTPNIILGGGKYQDLDSNAIRYVLSVVNLGDGQRNLTDMTFLPHGIHRHPTDPYRLAVFEKIGPGACEFNLATNSIVRTIPQVDKRYFYGHGVYAADGATLLATETQLDTKDGVIAIRASDDLSYLGEFPSYGKEPHECKLIDGGKTLVVTNGGGDLSGDAPCVTYIDIASQKLIEKVRLTNARLNTGHLAVNKDGSLVVVSAPRSGLGAQHLGGVSIRPMGAEIESIANPQNITGRMQGEALSVTVHETAGLAAVTHPDGNMVTFWSLRDRALVKVVELPKPRGVEITSDQQKFIVSYGDEANLVSIPVASLKPDSTSIIAGSYITGSHIYNWSREMTEILSPGPLA